jgi:large subunit ribosomal protein L3
MTQLNLEVIRVVPEKNILLVKGAVPGPLGGLLMIRKARKGGA